MSDIAQEPEAPSYTEKRRNTKLKRLAEWHELSLQELLEACAMDNMDITTEGNAICMNHNCNYICEMEPDQDRGWCESCKTNTMVSALVLAGMI